MCAKNTSSRQLREDIMIQPVTEAPEVNEAGNTCGLPKPDAENITNIPARTNSPTKEYKWNTSPAM
jgi:hypothetical protein